MMNRARQTFEQRQMHTNEISQRDANGISVTVKDNSKQMSSTYKKLKAINLFLVLSIVLILFSACNKGKKDRSLSLKELQERGIPNTNKVWTGKEYGKAYSVLMNIKTNEPYKLPRKGSEKSGEVFDRLTNRENMSFIKNDTIPLYVRAEAILRFLGTYDDIVDIYSNILMKKQYYTPELIETYLFGLDIMQEMLTLGEKINQSTNPDDVAFQEGFPAIQSFYISMLKKDLKIQLNSAEYSPEELETLCEGISASVKKNVSWLSQEQKKKLITDMQTVVDSTSSEKISAEYKKLIASLEE